MRALKCVRVKSQAAFLIQKLALSSFEKLSNDRVILQKIVDQLPVCSKVFIAAQHATKCHVSRVYQVPDWSTVEVAEDVLLQRWQGALEGWEQLPGHVEVLRENGRAHAQSRWDSCSNQQQFLVG